MKAKKSLGQNFLHSKSALRAIIGASDLVGDDIVLEIGPGKGVLTKELLSFAGKVIAVEKDSRLIQNLKEKFSKEIEESKFDLIEGDILDFDPEILSFYKLGYKVVANIPYYITGAVIRKFLSTKYQPDLMVLMVQKEVGRRIVARDKKESILSLSVKSYGTPRYITTVKKESFRPEPKVDSAILLVENISKDFFADFSEEVFFEIIKKGFGSKRKTLRNTLKPLLGEKVEEILASVDVDPRTRAEDLALEAWGRLARTYQKHMSVGGENHAGRRGSNKTEL